MSSDTQVFTAIKLFGKQQENFSAFHLSKSTFVCAFKGLCKYLRNENTITARAAVGKRK